MRRFWTVFAVFCLAYALASAVGAERFARADEVCATPSASCPLVASLLSQREGYGRFASGGLGGEFVTVVSNADSGPGSLREAVAGAVKPRWIRFASDMTIELKSQILVPPFVSIDGRDHLVTLYDYGLGVYYGSNNVIITHLVIDGRFRTFSQAINIANYAHDVWIDHLDLSRFNDRLVNVKNGSTDVTLSWIKFHDHNKVMLLNNLTNRNLFANYDRDSAARVTLHHCWFINTVQRNPRAQIGTFHIFNNLLENWDFYGMSFSLEARATVDGNIFVNSGSRACVEPAFFATVEGTEANYCKDVPTSGERAALPNGDSDRASYEKTKDQFGYTRDYRAFLKVGDNLYLGDAKETLEDYQPARVPPPPYCSSYEKPSVALADRIRREAGDTPTSAPIPISDCPTAVETEQNRPPPEDAWQPAKGCVVEAAADAGEIALREVDGSTLEHGVLKYVYGPSDARWTVDVAFKPIGGRDLAVSIINPGDPIGRIQAVCAPDGAEVVGRHPLAGASATSTPLAEGFARCVVEGKPSQATGDRIRVDLMTSEGRDIRPAGNSAKGLILRDVKVTPSALGQ